MSEEKSLGQELIDAIDEAINSEEKGRIVRAAIELSRKVAQSEFQDRSLSSQ